MWRARTNVRVHATGELALKIELLKHSDSETVNMHLVSPPMASGGCRKR